MKKIILILSILISQFAFSQLHVGVVASGGNVSSSNLLEFDVLNTTISAGALTNVIGGDWLVVRNSIAFYAPTSSTLTEVAIDVARIEGGKMLIESASTNLVTNSDNTGSFIDASTRITFTHNSVVSPDGNTTASNADSNLSDDISSYAIYDHSNGAWITTITSFSFSSSWERKKFTFTTPSGCTSVRLYLLRYSAGVYLYGVEGVSASTSYDLSYFVKGAVSDSLDIWGYSLEETQSSYIKTTGSTATRAADVITITVPTGATNAETWIDGVSDGGAAVTAGNTFTMLNETTKIIMN